jgi:hypothetical protein
MDRDYAVEIGDKVAFMEPGRPNYRGALPGTVLACNPTGYLVRGIDGKNYSVGKGQVWKSLASEPT